MESVQPTLVEDFERKLKKLFDLYEDLKDRNKKLSCMLQKQQEENRLLREQLAQANDRYETLKQTKVLSVSGHDIDATKQRVEKLVREIDRCIDMLDNEK